MSSLMESPAVNRLHEIRSRVVDSARCAGRIPSAVTLVAVSKGHPAEAVAELVQAGQTCFGENRVQEAAAKFAGLPNRASLSLHLIGPLQTNKVRQALELFDVIETIDRPALVQAVAKALPGCARRPRFMVQVNIGREPQKAGVAPEGLGELLRLCQQAGLAIEGLMCIPPAGVNPVPYFTELANLARAHGLAGLSMGMSADFEAAIACGATYIRVGTALFGAR